MTVRKLTTLSALLVVSIAALAVRAQPLDAPSTDPAATKPGAMVSGAQPVLRAELVDPQKKAAKREATVKAEAQNVSIVDPAASGEKPRKGEAHFHYRVDKGPVIASTAAKLSFHELTSGEHTIKVTLAGNDHVPVGQPVTLSVRVP